MSGELRFCFRMPLGHFDLIAGATFPGRGVTAIFGRSGCGKTSLLRCIAGLEKPPEAHLRVNGELWHDSEKGIFLPPQQRAIGYVFQEGALFPHLKVRDNLLYGYKRTPAAARNHGLDDVVELLGLAPLLDRYPARLSGGEKQRVAIGRALLNNPRLLLMDEPMASLDRSHKREILPYLEALHREASIPILYVTHDPDELVRIADHLALIEEGELIASGPLDDMLTRVDLPLARDVEAASVIHAKIVAKDEEYHLCELTFAGGQLFVQWSDLPIGSELRVRVQARDVSIALDRAGTTTVMNRLPATVVEMQAHGRGRMVVKLDLGGVPLLARVTRKAAATLALEPGKAVFAEIKGAALLA